MRPLEKGSRKCLWQLDKRLGGFFGLFGGFFRRGIESVPAQDARQVAQQFQVARQVLAHGLMPIVEPEVNIKSPDRADSDDMLLIAILEELDDRSHQLAPLLVVLFDPQEIDEERQIKAADGAGRDGAEPRGHPVWRVVADLLDLDRFAARHRQFAAIFLRDERLVRVRRQQLFGDLIPRLLETVGAAEGRRRDVLFGECEQPRPLVLLLY